MSSVANEQTKSTRFAVRAGNANLNTNGCMYTFYRGEKCGLRCGMPCFITRKGINTGFCRVCIRKRDTLMALRDNPPQGTTYNEILEELTHP